MPWLLDEGLWKMLVNFSIIIEVASVSKLGKTVRFFKSIFPTIITKEILERNVAFISFVGKITTIVARR